MPYAILFSSMLTWLDADQIPCTTRHMWFRDIINLSDLIYYYNQLVMLSKCEEIQP